MPWDGDALPRRRWRIFLSYTSELDTYPAGRSYVQAVRDAVRKTGHQLIDMKSFDAAPDRPVDFSAAEVRRCDVFIGLIGLRYGEIVPEGDEQWREALGFDPTGLSFCELEFEVAGQAGLPRLMFLLHDDATITARLIEPAAADKVRAYKERAKDEHIVKEFQRVTELDDLVQNAIRRLGRPPPPPPPPRPWWLRRALLVLAALAVIGLVVTLFVTLKTNNAGQGAADGPTTAAGPPPCASGAEGDLTRLVGVECVGYRWAGAPFATDPRLSNVQKAIFAENECAVRSGKPVATVIYFAGLTSVEITASGVTGGIWNAAPAEELEGLLAQQFVHNGQLLAQTGGCGQAPDTGDALKVVIANGGDKMALAGDVGTQLLAFMKSDQSVLGVIGLDRSTVRVKQLIRTFDAQGIPVVATTLSADGIGLDDHGNRLKSYFQLVPSNRAQGSLLRSVVSGLVSTDHRPRVLVVRIKQPVAASDLDYDLYTETLATDSARALTADGYADVVTVNWKPGDALCPKGPIDAIVYPGRHDTFAAFLNAAAVPSCGLANRPIIADDAVSRYVASVSVGTTRPQAPPVVRFVTKAPALITAGAGCVKGSTKEPRKAVRDFCSALGKTYRYLDATRKASGAEALIGHLSWPGERAGEDYDAVELLLNAADDGTPTAPARATVVTRLALPSVHNFEGAVGGYNFNSSRLSTGQLGLAEVSSLNDPKKAPSVCVAYVSDPKYGTVTCP